jgi:HD superfamily phosphohydrolase YqeK/putative methionine-R-sulfoxide reductase with GAF domain
MKEPEFTEMALSEDDKELSLLYRLSKFISSMSIDEIADRIVDEVSRTLGVKAAALLCLDEDNERLFTKSFRGRWHCDTCITREDRIIWSAIEEEKPIVCSDINKAGCFECAHAESSILVCPLIGKTRPIGAVVLADRETEEFNSNDIKLMMAISSHAALSIENAQLYRELEDFLIVAIRSLVKALEASSRWTAGHTERVTEYAVGIGEAMGLSRSQIERLTICSLLHDIGKIAVPKNVLDKKDLLTSDEVEEIKRHPLVGTEIMKGFIQLQDVVLGIRYHHEFWDGSIGFGLKGDEIPLMARILSVADSYDAMISERPYKKKKTVDEAIHEIKAQSGKQFDPKVVEAFEQWINQRRHASLP